MFVKQNGFSLVEVNLAILIVALGMLMLFALFPAGLKEANNAVIDTDVALFADFVLSGVEGNASTVTNWQTWANPSEFVVAVTGPQLIAMDGNQIVADGAVHGPIVHAGRNVRYLLQIGGGTNSRLRSVELCVQSGEYGPSSPVAFREVAKRFYAECFYCGM